MRSSLLAQLKSSEHDKFAAHLYRSRREYHSACQRPAKTPECFYFSLRDARKPQRIRGSAARLGCAEGRATGKRLHLSCTHDRLPLRT